MFQYLRALGLAPIEWNEAVALTRKGAPFIYEIVDAGLQEAHAVVVLLTGDDITHLRSELAGGHHLSAPETPTPQARPNVLFEAGMALGRMPTRTALVTLGQLRPFSDIAGMHAIEMSDASTHRVALAERLRTIGCPVNTSATQWLAEGDFNAAVPSLPCASRQVRPVTTGSPPRPPVKSLMSNTRPSRKFTRSSGFLLVIRNGSR